MIKKFRAWDKKNKKWIDDCDIAINQKGLLFIRYEHQVEFQPMSLTKSSNFEVVFYTGIKDKNGVEICEGDIFDSPSKRKFIVEWYKYKFVLRNIFDEHYSFTLGETSSCWGVIGNKFENPKLK